jgi:hypothetical protein
VVLDGCKDFFHINNQGVCLCVCMCVFVVCTMCSNGFHKLEVKSPWELGCHDWSNQRLVCNFSCEVSPAIACPPKNILLIFFSKKKKTPDMGICPPFPFFANKVGRSVFLFFLVKFHCFLTKKLGNFWNFFSSVNLINFANFLLNFTKNLIPKN